MVFWPRRDPFFCLPRCLLPLLGYVLRARMKSFLNSGCFCQSEIGISAIFVYLTFIQGRLFFFFPRNDFPNDVLRSGEVAKPVGMRGVAGENINESGFSGFSVCGIVPVEPGRRHRIYSNPGQYGFPLAEALLSP